MSKFWQNDLVTAMNTLAGELYGAYEAKMQRESRC